MWVGTFFFFNFYLGYTGQGSDFRSVRLILAIKTLRSTRQIRLGRVNGRYFFDWPKKIYST